MENLTKHTVTVDLNNKYKDMAYSLGRISGIIFAVCDYPNKRNGYATVLKRHFRIFTVKCTDEQWELLKEMLIDSYDDSLFEFN